MKSPLFYVLLCLLPLKAYADNEDSRLQFKYGIEMQQQRKENQIVEQQQIFGENMPAKDEDLVFMLMKAVNHQDVAETGRLLAIYKQQADYDPDMVLFVEANQALFENNLKTAIARYRELYRRNPKFLRGKLDLARLLFVDKQNKESAALFAEIDIPDHPVINEKVQGFVTALKKRNEWDGSVSLGMGYDTNLNRSSGETVLREQESCGFDTNGAAILDEDGNFTCRSEWLPASTPKAIKNRMWQYEAGLNRRISLQGHHGIQLNGYALGKFYPENKDYNEHDVSFGMAYNFQNKDNSFSIGPQIQYEWAGNKVQSSNAGMMFSYNRSYADQASLGFRVEHKYDHYRGPYKHFNGPQTFVFTNGLYVLPKNWILFGGYDYLRKNSLEKVDSYRRHGLRIGLNKQFNSGLEATVFSIWRKTAYQDYHAWLNTRRKDFERTYQLDIKYNRPFLHGFVPVLTLKRSHNKSTSWINRYRRNEIMLKAEYNF